MKRMLFLAILFVLPTAHAAEIETNAIHMSEAPSWITRPRMEKIIDRIQTQLEWTIRKAEAFYYSDSDAFQKAHHLGPNVIAVARKDDNTIHLGPKVTTSNFDTVFGHELVHIIFAQKYKGAIPSWLEEGLANYIAKHDKVDYKWLAKQTPIEDVRQLTHPQGGTVQYMRYHYVASQALAEMIAKKCDLSNLLRLSVERNMDDYLKTYCEIGDLNAEFKKWVKVKGS